MATKSKTTPHSDRRSHYTTAASREESATDSMVMDESGLDQIVEEVPGSMESAGPRVWAPNLRKRKSIGR